jgi:hypothetical protein
VLYHLGGCHIKDDLDEVGSPLQHPTGVSVAALRPPARAGKGNVASTWGRFLRPPSPPFRFGGKPRIVWWGREKEGKRAGKIRRKKASYEHPHPVNLSASGRARHYHWTGPGGTQSTVPGERTLTSAQGPEQTNPSRRQPSK